MEIVRVAPNIRRVRVPDFSGAEAIFIDRNYVFQFDEFGRWLPSLAMSTIKEFELQPRTKADGTVVYEHQQGNTLFTTDTE